jgi:hypothetical protein
MNEDLPLPSSSSRSAGDGTGGVKRRAARRPPAGTQRVDLDVRQKNIIPGSGWNRLTLDQAPFFGLGVRRVPMFEISAVDSLDGFLAANGGAMELHRR